MSMYKNNKTKICINCYEELPLTLDYFHKDKRNKDGYRANCKKCYNAKAKLNRLKRKTLNLEKKQKSNIEGHKMCRKCKNILPANLSYFYADKRGQFGLRGSCIVCENRLYDDFSIFDTVNKQSMFKDKFNVLNVTIKNDSYFSISDFYKNIFNKKSRTPKALLLKYEAKLCLFEDNWNRDFFISLNDLRNLIIDKHDNISHSKEDVIKHYLGDDSFVILNSIKEREKKKKEKPTFVSYSNELQKYINEKDEDSILYYCLKNRVLYEFKNKTYQSILDKVLNFEDIPLNHLSLLFNLYMKDENVTNILDAKFYNFFFSLNLTYILRKKYDNKTLNFALEYTNFKIPIYKFVQSGHNMYSDISNRTRDFRFFIEKDLCIDIWRIPFELTSSAIWSNTKLGNAFKKYYNCDLFALVDDCYPKMFKPHDFKVKDKLSDFDSNTELQIDKIIRKYFKNVIYNTRYRDNSVNLDGKIPDWIIIDKKPIIIEYFGLYVENSKSTMCQNYVDRTNQKILEYEQMTNYDKIYIYPEDTKNCYNGVYEKLDLYLKHQNNVN